MEARYASVCRVCKKPISPGDPIGPIGRTGRYGRKVFYGCVDCAAAYQNRLNEENGEWFC